MLNNSIQNTTKKSYWDRPDGKVGIIAGVCLLGYAGLKLLPILTAIVWNTINFGIALGVGFALFMIVSNKKFRLSMGYLYQLFFKKLTGFVIELDPFIIAETYIQNMIKEQVNLKNKLSELLGQREDLSKAINDNKTELDRNQARYKVGEKNNDEVVMQTAAAEIGQISTTNNSLIDKLNNIDIIADVLDKMDKNSTIVIKNAQSSLKHTKREYYLLLKANSALNSALSIINGDPDEREMLERSAEAVQMTMSNELAKMKQGIKQSNEYLKQVNLNRAVDVEVGKKIIQELQASQQIPMNQIVSNTSTKEVLPRSYDRFENI
jgi:hypothetical protein